MWYAVNMDNIVENVKHDMIDVAKRALPWYCESFFAEIEKSMPNTWGDYEFWDGIPIAMGEDLIEACKIV